MAKGNPYTCYSWPKCICHDRYRLWSANVDEWIANPVPEEVVRGALFGIYVMFCCIEHNCHDREWRRAATIELMHPVWSDLRREYPR